MRGQQARKCAAGKRRPLLGERPPSANSEGKLPAVAVPATISVNVSVAVEVFNAATVANEVPSSGNPIAVGLVAGDPDISGSGAGRNIGYRSAHVDSKFSCLGRCRSQRQAASHHGSAKHPALHVAHKPSIPASRFFMRPARLLSGGGLSLAASPASRLSTCSTEDANKGCAAV